MSSKFRLPRPGAVSALKRAGPVAAALAAILVLVPAASAGTYTDPAGDSATAGDVTGVSVVGDKASGQLLFRITGTNLASSDKNVVFLTIDSDANPLTGNIADNGSDYWFVVDNGSYWFMRWNGSDWDDTSTQSVRVSGGRTQILISVNRSEVGNTSSFNFVAATLDLSAFALDEAPDDGAFNYSLEANGPQIDSVNVRTTPSAGPKAGKRFVVTPTGLKLPPDGRANATPPAAESYSCTAKLGARRLVGSGTGGCTFAIPKKKARGKRLTVVLTVNYQGATKTVPLTFKVS
jgi:hypothetical protein